MPETFRVDAGQLVLIENESGHLTFDVIDGVDSVAQRLGILLQTRLGEDPLHPTIGMPVPSIIGSVSPTYMQGVTTGALKQDPAVLTVDEVQVQVLNPLTRQRKIRAKFTLDAGQVVELDTEV